MKVMNKEKNKNKCRANKDCKLIVFLMMNLKMQGQIVQTIYENINIANESLNSANENNF
jgi:hypothetical protein